MTQIYIWLEREAPWLGYLSPLFAATCAALLLVVVGGAVASRGVRIGGAVRFAGNLLMLAVFALAVMRFVRMDPSFDAALHSVGGPAQTVSGGETRIPLSADGHYWIKAKLNGVPLRLMVDTGATVTALSGDVAEAAGVEPDRLRPDAVVETANGTVPAAPARIDELRFGSVVARDLDAIVMPGEGGPNVIGMNVLTRLKGWRVEDGVLILTPHRPQVESSASGEPPAR
ncbi:MAG: TIGR02281 family clan AA aspartic protease [Sphingomonadales bacterium]|uniref:retropepsin-like aspartic protease family protein n=1 Tax=Novosphingobium sp. NDB2Meth1 TaxID=1892847 RepID=UPI0009FB8767|nr:TIGR02281 family clan AA aspartic protease [Novosphingobium sp. NDB2Meth1]MBU6395145.1 TIGR02281 family clan AA aspartic protease [Sphingomonadales bacterium]MBY0393034.1 TIGR02281 family clan AA aspartic protease [Novosphingobium sp.]